MFLCFSYDQGSDDELGVEITRDFHFGGGLLTKRAEPEDGAEAEGEEGAVLDRKKTKKEARRRPPALLSFPPQCASTRPQRLLVPLSQLTDSPGRRNASPLDPSTTLPLPHPRSLLRSLPLIDVPSAITACSSDR